MARITALEPDARRPGAVRVLVDGRLFCTVHEAALGPELVIGAEWDEGRRRRADVAADEEGAWRAALRALERRGFAEVELRRRLRQKGHPPAAVDYVIERARGAGLVDDAQFALRFVESRAARGRGPARLRRDLLALGVDLRHIEAALRAQWSEPDEALTLARQLAERRLRQLSRFPPETRRRRVLAFLGRRGFTGARVAELVARLLRGNS
jgi:regulatory protein